MVKDTNRHRRGWFIILMFMNLSMTYIQYHVFKTQMGMYTPSQRLLQKLEEAKRINKELEKVIKENELSNSTKLGENKKC